jgi:hypothetical protein
MFIVPPVRERRVSGNLDAKRLRLFFRVQAMA